MLAEVAPHGSRPRPSSDLKDWPRTGQPAGLWALHVGPVLWIVDPGPPTLDETSSAIGRKPWWGSACIDWPTSGTAWNFTHETRHFSLLVCICQPVLMEAGVVPRKQEERNITIAFLLAASCLRYHRHA
ncbi:hypothetical protein CKAH01_13243 [Colletotrichum kahawae]|uniref:Uncharacterized protein n=1 Tax=Colletotrichum kahawae TaxID=34407 RepID=A0AAD9YQF8_COLKA|nr:hypothetical protein CKAH01_13243 [Colletotrichum kahawae]